MEIEKTLVVSAPRERVWELLLDPHVMTGAVPGMQSIEVISPTEYVALMKVKISFISAKFKLHTHIVEQRAPEYLRAQGTGEDASVASSLKQTSEVFLTSTPEGGTELRIKVNVDVLGRLGTFGLSVMKTKADRMWEEFGKNLEQRIDGVADASQEPATSAKATSEKETAGGSEAEPGPAVASAQANTSSPASRSVGQPSEDEPQVKGWFSRLLGGGGSTASRSVGKAGQCIRIEVRQINQTIAIEWPVEAADQCQDWLRELLNRPVA